MELLMTNTLIDTVYGIIHKNNPTIADTFKEIFLMPSNNSVGAHHKALNDFWTLHIGMQSVDSIEARSYLANDIEVSDWLMYFENNVLPFILENNVLDNQVYRQAAPW